MSHKRQHSSAQNKNSLRVEIDELDRDILSILLKDANVPYTDVARELSVSSGTIHVRMKRLTETGVVLGARLYIAPPTLGFDICAFVGIYLEKGSVYRDAVEALEKIPEVIELHYMTGNYSMFAKLICTDTRHLREVLNDKIQTMPGVERTETFISLEQSINREVNLDKVL
jgi:Lrp/AsnC family transcriptional regulator, regulator for asnA, asnC and gidA